MACNVSRNVNVLFNSSSEPEPIVRYLFEDNKYDSIMNDLLSSTSDGSVIIDRTLWNNMINVQVSDFDYYNKLKESFEKLLQQQTSFVEIEETITLKFVESVEKSVKFVIEKEYLKECIFVKGWSLKCFHSTNADVSRFVDGILSNCLNSEQASININTCSYLPFAMLSFTEIWRNTLHKFHKPTQEQRRQRQITQVCNNPMISENIKKTFSCFTGLNNMNGGSLIKHDDDVYEINTVQDIREILGFQRDIKINKIVFTMESPSNVKGNDTVNKSIAQGNLSSDDLNNIFWTNKKAVLQIAANTAQHEDNVNNVLKIAYSLDYNIKNLDELTTLYIDQGKFFISGTMKGYLKLITPEHTNTRNKIQEQILTIVKELQENKSIDPSVETENKKKIQKQIDEIESKIRITEKRSSTFKTPRQQKEFQEELEQHRQTLTNLQLSLKTTLQQIIDEQEKKKNELEATLKKHDANISTLIKQRQFIVYKNVENVNKCQLNAQRATTIVLNIVKFIQILHDKGLHHTDISPKNIYCNTKNTTGTYLARYEKVTDIGDIGIIDPLYASPRVFAKACSNSVDEYRNMLFDMLSKILVSLFEGSQLKTVDKAYRSDKIHSIFLKLLQNANSTFTKNSNTETKNSNTETKNSNAETKNSNAETKNSNTETTNSNAETKNSNAETKNSNAKTKNSNTETKNSNAKTKNSNTETKNSNTETKNSNAETKNYETNDALEIKTCLYSLAITVLELMPTFKDNNNNDFDKCIRMVEIMLFNDIRSYSDILEQIQSVHEQTGTIHTNAQPNVHKMMTDANSSSYVNVNKGMCFARKDNPTILLHFTGRGQYSFDVISDHTLLKYVRYYVDDTKDWDPTKTLTDYLPKYNCNTYNLMIYASSIRNNPQYNKNVVKVIQAILDGLPKDKTFNNVGVFYKTYNYNNAIRKVYNNEGKPICKYMVNGIVDIPNDNVSTTNALFEFKHIVSDEDSEFAYQHSWWLKMFKEVVSDFATTPCGHKRFKQFEGTCWFNATINSLILVPSIATLLIYMFGVWINKKDDNEKEYFFEHAQFASCPKDMTVEDIVYTVVYLLFIQGRYARPTDGNFISHYASIVKSMSVFGSTQFYIDMVEKHGLEKAKLFGSGHWSELALKVIAKNIFHPRIALFKEVDEYRENYNINLSSSDQVYPYILFLGPAEKGNIIQIMNQQLDKEIFINNSTVYVLQSAVMRIQDKTDNIHALHDVACVICNNKGYIYNSWDEIVQEDWYNLQFDNFLKHTNNSKKSPNRNYKFLAFACLTYVRRDVKLLLESHANELTE